MAKETNMTRSELRVRLDRLLDRVLGERQPTQLERWRREALERIDTAATVIRDAADHANDRHMSLCAGDIARMAMNGITGHLIWPWSHRPTHGHGGPP
jgi:hypothetical protein